MGCNLPGLSVHGLLQARILERVARPSPRGSSQPRDRTCISCLLHWQVGSLPLAPPGKPRNSCNHYLKKSKVTCECKIFTGPNSRSWCIAHNQLVHNQKCAKIQCRIAGQWHPTPVLLPGKSHGRRSLEGCSPWGRWGLDTTEQLHFHCSLSCIGEGNGTPLQCSCLENPRDGGGWWAAVYGVAQSRTRLKWLSR